TTPALLPTRASSASLWTQGRMGQVAIDPILPVKAFMDIGGAGHSSDAMAIWICQFVSREIRLLDYIEGVIKRKSEREEPMKSERDGINPAVEPSGTSCVECLALGGWWLHLRRCAECGHIGCCDNSPNQHASKHNAATGHPIITSFEPRRAVVLRLSYGAILRRPEASRSSLASVGSTGARTGRSGAFKLANAASRIGAAFWFGREPRGQNLGITRPI